MRPTGEQFEIASGPYRAVVTQVGATLRGLWYRDRPLIRGFMEDQAMPVHRGAILAPWPNRIGDGRYEWGGEPHQLPINEPARQCALHGLVAWLQWSCEERDKRSVTLSCVIWPQPGYPFAVGLSVTYRLAADGLTITLSADNRGSTPAPYGCSIHPYLVPGPKPMESWNLRLRAASFITVDPARLLPTGKASVAGTDFDFRNGRAIASSVIDHAFTDIEFDESDMCDALVTAEDGSGVAMTWDRRCGWVQVHTADRPEPEYNRAGLAIEPMTCPPDAFRSGEGVHSLQPGATFESWWRLAYAPPLHERAGRVRS
jgi:aldose 1-epimerase